MAPADGRPRPAPAGPSGLAAAACLAVLSLAVLTGPAFAQEREADPDARPVVAREEPEERTANDGNVILSGVPEVPPEISERLAPYQNTRSAGFVSWTEDGRGIYIGTRFADVAQLHRVDMPGGARHQLTFSGEPVRGVTRRPGHGQVLYRMDEGGGEFFQLFLLDPRDGSSRRLTDGASRNTQPAWSRDGRVLAFTSTRRDGRSNDIWVMTADDTASARMALEAPSGTFWGTADWDAAGERLLVANYVSITASSAHLLDAETGELRPLAGGPDRPGVHIAVGFDRDDDGIFLLTDREGEFNQLAYMPLEGGPVEIVTGDISWNVEGVVLSRDRDRGAFSVNEGGISRLYLLDPATRRYRPVEGLPMGILSGGEFSPDGRRLAFTLNTPGSPSDVFTLELGEDPLEQGEVTRWTFSEVGGLDPETFVTPELIEYPTFDDRMIPAFLYRPEGPGPHPVVIRIHGGPESQSRPGFSSLYQSWIHELGVAVLDPNVRGSSGYGRSYVSLDDGMLREDAVRDIGALLDWIAERPELDQDRVMVYGGSYGGQVRANGHPVWYMNALNEGHGFARRENQDLMRDLVVLFMETHLLP